MVTQNLHIIIIYIVLAAAIILTCNNTIVYNSYTCSSIISLTAAAKFPTAVMVLMVILPLVAILLCSSNIAYRSDIACSDNIFRNNKYIYIAKHYSKPQYLIHQSAKLFKKMISYILVSAAMHLA